MKELADQIEIEKQAETKISVEKKEKETMLNTMKDAFYDLMIDES